MQGQRAALCYRNLVKKASTSLGRRLGQASTPLRLGAGLAFLVATLVLLTPPQLAAAGGSQGYGVTTESPTATRDAGLVLSQGGSAADAAIVAALVAGVTSPTSSGIGGGGFALVWERAKKPYILDFRETAPAGLVREPFENRPLAADQVGHLIGVPGEVLGLYELHQRSGKKEWRDLVMRAADRAIRGFPVGQHLGSMLAYAEAKMKGRPGFSQIFYAGGKPALVGSRLTFPALGATLTKIAQLGPSAFYSGEVAEDIVTTAQAHGSSLSLDDLKSYQVKQREPLLINYEGQQIYTMPPPSAGGLMIAQMLALFPSDYLRNLKHGSPAYHHAIAEAMRGSIADRMRYLGDPDFEKFDLNALLSEERMNKRRSIISLQRTHALPRFGLEEKGTHALVTSDREGNVVSLTTTVNQLFGAKIMAEKSGVILNNELDDFGSIEQVKPFGMTETPNRARPSARPVSSMTPTIVVRDGAAFLALGGSGGTAITTNATQTLLAALIFDHEPQKAVAADRIYLPSDHRSLLVEKGTKEAHIKDLERRGEVVDTMPFTTTAIQMLRLSDGRVTGGADPRKHGLFTGGK